MEQAKDFVHGFGYNSVSFSDIYLIVRTYNKCFCDQCIYRYLYRPWFSITGYYFRMFVYDDFYIGIYQYLILLKQGTSLVQQVIKAVTPYFKCCQHKYDTRPTLKCNCNPRQITNYLKHIPHRNIENYMSEHPIAEK